MSRALTRTEQELLTAFREGKGIILNCNIEFGVQLADGPDGRIVIRVDPAPRISVNTPAWTKTVRFIVRRWTAILDQGSLRRLH